MNNIGRYPLRKLAGFLRYAYEKEVEERWNSIYPFMEAGIINYVSLEDYKKKVHEKSTTNNINNNLTDEQIMKQGLTIVEVYERQQRKGEIGNGNI